MSPRIRADILIEHAEEIEILWSRRRAALWSPRETLATLAALERRLDAHVDGLALDVEGAHECFERGLAGADADAAFAIAATLLRQQTLSSLERVFAALRTTTPDARAGIGEALAYEPLTPAVEQRLEELLANDDATPAARIAAEALAAHGRRAPVHVAPSLAQARAACADPDRSQVAQLFALGALGDARDVPILVHAASRSALAEVAVRGLGSLGSLEAAEALLALMPADTTGPAAGAAFWRITGLEPVARAGAPAPDDAGHFEELRPWPDAGRMQELWRGRAAAFAGGGRWRYGRPIDPRRWLAEPHAGDLLTRREEITRLRGADPGALANLDLDAPASRQRNWTP